MKKLLLLATFIFTLPTYGQTAARYDGVVIDQTGKPVVGINVRVCNSPAAGQPCTPLTNIFTDINLTFPAANPISTDFLGNFYFYVATGTYELEFSGATLTTKQVPDVTITAPGVGTVSNVTGTANQIIIVNNTTTPVVSLAPALILPGSLTVPGVLDATSTSDFTGLATFLGGLTTTSIQNSVLNSRTFYTQNLPGTDVCLRMQEALTIAGNTNAIIDARGEVGPQNCTVNWGANLTGSAGIIVYLPVYPITMNTSTAAWVINANNVYIWGGGVTGATTRLNAGSSFPASTPMVTLGSSANQSSSLQLHDISINCTSGPSTCTPYAQYNLQEFSGLFFSNLIGANSASPTGPCAEITDPAGGGHWFFVGNSIGSCGDNDAIYVLQEGTTGGQIDHITCNNTGKVTGTDCVQFSSISSNNTLAYADHIHAEGFAITCEFGSHTGGSCEHADSTGTNTTVLQIDSGALTVMAISISGAGVNQVLDNSVSPSVTLTVAQYPKGVASYTNSSTFAKTLGLTGELTTSNLNGMLYANSFATGAGTSGSPWVSTSGTGGCQEAVNALAATGGMVVVPDGVYSITSTTGCVPADNVWISFADRNAVFFAGANNVKFFSTANPSGHAYYSQIQNATLDGNGFTGVTGFDLTNFRDGSGLFSPRMNNMTNGVILRAGDFSTTVYNAYFSAVTSPIQAFGGANTVNIDYPQIDDENFPPSTACSIGISVSDTTQATVGLMIKGGYVQGCTDGVEDSAIGTRIINVYGEANSDADIFENSATNCYVEGTTHFANLGASAIKGRSSTGCQIQAPVMGSGARSTGLYDWDGSNSDSFEFHTTNAGSMNLPLGTTTGLFTFLTTAGTNFTAGLITGLSGDALVVNGGSGSLFDFNVRNVANTTNLVIVKETGETDVKGAVIPGSFTVSTLPSVSGSIGGIATVTDSTAISAEGQTCVGGSTSTALAFSNGSVWKCF